MIYTSLFIFKHLIVLNLYEFETKNGCTILGTDSPTMTGTSKNFAGTEPLSTDYSDNW